jgi:carboxypeptidase C (cathepsin A)
MSREEHLEKVSQDIFNVFNPKIECDTENGCYDTCEEYDDYVIGEEYQRQQWIVSYTVDMSHDEVKDHLVTLYGPPTGKFFRKDLNLDVNNWNVGKVHIVQVRDSITLYQDYSKV